MTGGTLCGVVWAAQTHIVEELAQRHCEGSSPVAVPALPQMIQSEGRCFPHLGDRAVLDYLVEGLIGA